MTPVRDGWVCGAAQTLRYERKPVSLSPDDGDSLQPGIASHGSFDDDAVPLAMCGENERE